MRKEKTWRREVGSKGRHVHILRAWKHSNMSAHFLDWIDAQAPDSIRQSFQKTHEVNVHLTAASPACHHSRRRGELSPHSLHSLTPKHHLKVGQTTLLLTYLSTLTTIH
jgi:hypothetical protein